MLVGKTFEAHNRTLVGAGVRVGFGGGETVTGTRVTGNCSVLGTSVSGTLEQPARNSSVSKMEAAFASFTVLLSLSMKTPW